MDMETVKEIIQQIPNWLNNRWPELIIMYFISSVYPADKAIKKLVEGLLALVKKLPDWIQKPIKALLNMLGKELDEQIPDEEVKP